MQASAYELLDEQLKCLKSLLFGSQCWSLGSFFIYWTEIDYLPTGYSFSFYRILSISAGQGFFRSTWLTFNYVNSDKKAVVRATGPGVDVLSPNPSSPTCWCVALHLCLPLFTHLRTEDYGRIYSIGLLWRFNVSYMKNSQNSAWHVQSKNLIHIGLYLLPFPLPSFSPLVLDVDPVSRGEGLKYWYCGAKVIPFPKEAHRQMRMTHNNSLTPLPSLLDFSYFYHKFLTHLFQHSVSACPNWGPQDVPQADLGCWVSHLNLLHTPWLIGSHLAPRARNLSDFCFLWSKLPLTQEVVPWSLRNTCIHGHLLNKDLLNTYYSLALVTVS